MTQALERVQQQGTDIRAVEKLVAEGDMSRLSPADRVKYYFGVCESVGLNPHTRPFEYVSLQGKLTLYAKRDATDQLRKIHGVSITIVSREIVDGVLTVIARATDKTGRQDESIGALNVGGLKGDAMANAQMKAETKAKRRVTLSICGLGWLDESELPSVQSAKPVQVDADGVIVEAPKSEPTLDPELLASTLLVAISKAETMGALQEAWSDASRARKDIPAELFERIKAVKDERKAELQAKNTEAAQ